MKIYLNKIKENWFFLLLIVTFLVFFRIDFSMGTLAVKNTAYYIKEMLMIMPVVFILTALLDTWISKDTIMKFLGKDAGLKGLVLSFVLGSISAGPIYAAFPVCVMLHNKGASVRNIVVILSAWAVIKVPMLVNEAAFLGMKFTITRWISTVIAIIIFSWIASIIVKDNEIVTEVKELKSEIYLDSNVCIGCKMCTKSYSQLFEMNGKKAAVSENADLCQIDEEKLEYAISSCPVSAIIDNRG